MLSNDDVNLGEMSDEELDAAWDLWFDLAQWTNESDPPYSIAAWRGVDRCQCAGVTGHSPV